MLTQPLHLASPPRDARLHCSDIGEAYVAVALAYASLAIAWIVVDLAAALML